MTVEYWIELVFGNQRNRRGDRDMTPENSYSPPPAPPAPPAPGTTPATQPSEQTPDPAQELAAAKARADAITAGQGASSPEVAGNEVIGGQYPPPDAQPPTDAPPPADAPPDKIPPTEEEITLSVRRTVLGHGVSEEVFARDLALPIEERERLITDVCKDLGGEPPTGDQLTNIAARCITVGALIDLFVQWVAEADPNHPANSGAGS